MKRRASVFLLMLLLLTSASSHANCECSGQANGQLDGEWVVKSVSWCGRLLPLSEKEKMAMRLTFSKKKFKHALGKPDSPAEEGTFQVNLDKSPKHLDLHYTKGELLAIRKCIFEQEGDELKVAYSMPFLPGTPEQELQRAKEMFAKRPKSFDSGPDDSTVVLVLKRHKK
jgi:uncharacterized protein (TIGR03067 family)